jgi:hypothetical protein
MANNKLGRLDVLITELIGLVLYNPVTDNLFRTFYDFR